MSLYPDDRIKDRLKSVSDPIGFLTNLFAHAPVGLSVWSADGQVLVRNKAFMDMFVAEPRAEHDVLEDDVLARNGMLELFQRALAGETVEVPTFWYDPRESKTTNVKDGPRVAISMTIFPLFEENGEVHYVGATYKDETRMLSATAQLRSSEERLRLAQHAAHIGTFELNLQTGVNTWTPELEALHGLEPGEFKNTQQNWEELILAEDRPAALARVNEALETFLPVEGEWRVRWPDGSLHWLVGRFQVLKDEAGRPHRLIGVNMEVTERKKEEAVRRNAESVARESEESLRITLNSIGDAVIATDTEGRVTRMNPVAEQLTGWQLREASGRKLAEVFHIRNEENREVVQSPVERVLREGVVVGLANHTVLVSRDGTERAITDSGAPIRDANGRLLGVVLVFRDQTADRQAERALQSSDARKGAILEAALDCIVSIDHTGAITEFNPAAERTFGYARADVMGKPLAEHLIPPSLRERHRKAVERYLATGVGSILGKRVELTAMRADGSEFPAELAVVRTRSEGPPTFTAYVRDLSEHKKARDALRVSEARFRHLSESGIIGIIVGDTQGNIHEANDAFLRMVGFSREEFASGKMRWADMTPPEWRPFDDAAAEVLRETGAKAWEKEYVRKDGSRIPVLVVVAILEGSVGIAFVLDLTEQKRA
ncbi:MAG TPA: PAS domain S-box protein, partial [Polyangiaceae bacterium]|nr:PAS domain S-box protein [Polyangiaceae bacterium]